GTLPPPQPQPPKRRDRRTASGGLRGCGRASFTGRNAGRRSGQQTFAGLRQFVWLSWLLKAPRRLRGNRRQLNPPAAGCRHPDGARIDSRTHDPLALASLAVAHLGIGKARLEKGAATPGT